MSIRRTLCIAISALGIATLTAIPASASPVADKQAEAARLQASIEANGQKISAAAEAYNAAVLKLNQTQGLIAQAEANLRRDQGETDNLKSAVSERAAQMYVQAATGGSEDTRDFASEQLAKRYASSATSRNKKVVDTLADHMEQIAAERARLDTVKKQAEAQKNEASKRKRDIEALNAKSQQLLGQVKGQIADLMRQQQLASVQAAARRSGGAVVSSVTEFPANLPPASPRAATAIAFARAQLGKPYVYAATGPNSYDCSGLTMAAWGAAGVGMPHFSGAQYASFPHVPLGALEPGDLVFYGPGGGNHVAMYIGNGLMIEAPHTGAVVRVTGLRPPMGAARPG
ncbi:MAG: NlpC/P60 family protein [Acidimicrobiia bacterium]